MAGATSTHRILFNTLPGEVYWWITVAGAIPGVDRWPGWGETEKKMTDSTEEVRTLLGSEDAVETKTVPEGFWGSWRSPQKERK